MALFTFSKIRSLKCVASLSRFLSNLKRPVASLDQTIELDTYAVPSRKHFKNPGATSRGVVRLPAELRKAIDKIIADKSPAILLREAHKLRNHLDNKKPPLSQVELDNIKAECQNSFNREKPPPDTTYMTQEDADRIKNSRKSIIMKITEQNTYRWKPIVYDKASALTYLVARLAPDYASLTHVLNEIRLRDPIFQPATMFDFGSGVGSGIWAARSCWGNQSLKEMFCVDSSAAMNSLALAMLQGGIWPSESDLAHDEYQSYNENPNPLLKGLFFRQFLPSASAVKYDLVISAHTLLELPSTELRLQTALSLWRKSQGYLVFVEHGSRAAFEVIAEVRDFLLQLSNNGSHKGLEGHVFAPCPHEYICPRLADNTPCNYEVTYEPLFISRKGNFSTERYSYLVLKKGHRPEGDKPWPRIVRPVLARSGHTICRLCTNQGTLDEVVITRAKHSKITNQCARHAQWGDRLPVDLSWKSDNSESSGVSSDEDDVKSNK